MKINFSIKKIVTCTLATLISVPLFAQTQESPTNKREAIFQKYKNSKPFIVAFYNGRNTNIDMNGTTNKYLPLANYFSDKLERLVLFDVDTSSNNLSESVLDTSDIIYTTPIMYEKLTKLGWVPLVARNFDLSPSYIVKKSSDVTSLEGLKDKKVVSYEPTLLNYALYNFITSSVYTDLTSAEKYIKSANTTDTEALLKDVYAGNYDSLIVRDREGKKMLATGDKYRLIKGTVSGPDLIVFYNPKNSSIDSNKIKGLFLSMTEDNVAAKDALVAAKEFTPGENNQFRELNKQDLEFLKSLSATLSK